MEQQQVTKFIEDIKKDGASNFTYQTYENWCANNNELPIANGRFNAIIFSTFGFAWNLQTGFSLK